jgi:hypothetical protein
MIVPLTFTGFRSSWTSNNLLKYLHRHLAFIPGKILSPGKHYRLIITSIILLLIPGCTREDMKIPAGYKVSFTIDGVEFKIAYVPPKTFYNDTTDTVTSTVPKAYWIGETLVTYELWSVVYKWATGDAK